MSKMGILWEYGDIMNGIQWDFQKKWDFIVIQWDINGIYPLAV